MVLCSDRSDQIKDAVRVAVKMGGGDVFWVLLSGFSEYYVSEM